MRIKKDWKIVYSLIDAADILLEVLDARFPEKTRCIPLEQKVSEEKKDLILCLNKSDLIPRSIALKWKKILSREYPTVYISARDRLGTKILRNFFKQISQGADCIVAVAGFPNTGKSSIINALKGRHSAPTAATPGWTKHGQLYRISDSLALYDSPGVLPYEGSVEDHVIFGGYPIDKLEDPQLVAQNLLDKIFSEQPEVIHTRYQFNFSKDQFLEKLAHNRGRLLPGGIPDVEQAARTFLRDFVDGKIAYWEEP